MAKQKILLGDDEDLTKAYAMEAREFITKPTQRIREMTENASIPIYALTANVTQTCKDTSKLVGMDGFIEKPIRTPS